MALIISTACSEHPVTIQNDSPGSSGTGTVSSAARTEQQTNPFNPTVGAPIDYDQGERWIDNYESSSTTQATTYTIKSAPLATILSGGNCVGISLVYAVDFQQRLHILPIGVNSNGRWIKSKTVYTQNGDVTWQTAQCWIKNYTGSVQSHFFGQNTFSRLWTGGKADVVVSFARDDNNNPQLLLTAPSPARTNGRTAGSGYEDASSPCPPVCPK
ncbi:MAG TPA: hypothetical protein VIM75_01910 [Ohtaekwangia sp.]|uniref:hypothetical protein n=1 Tax=Ohtaekwangia sp. TaxID=2066019 RepID=UPI002F938C0D